MQGIAVTVLVLISSAVLGYLIAFIAGFGRMSKNALIRRFTIFYIEIFRGTSLIVQLFWFYFVLFDSSYWAAVMAIALNYGAYMSEIVRGSIMAVPHGQTEAATALNMSNFQRMRLVILPQAVRMMLPEFGNYLIQMLKATSLVSMVSLHDITYEGMLLRNDYTLTVPVFTSMLIIYFLLAQPLIWLTRWFEKVASKGVAANVHHG